MGNRIGVSVNENLLRVSGFGGLESEKFVKGNENGTSESIYHFREGLSAPPPNFILGVSCILYVNLHLLFVILQFALRLSKNNNHSYSLSFQKLCKHRDKKLQCVLLE